MTKENHTRDRKREKGGWKERRRAQRRLSQRKKGGLWMGRKRTNRAKNLA